MAVMLEQTADSLPLYRVCTVHSDRIEYIEGCDDQIDYGRMLALGGWGAGRKCSREEAGEEGGGAGGGKLSPTIHRCTKSRHCTGNPCCDL